MAPHTTLDAAALAAVLELFPFPACLAATPSGRVLSANRAFVERCGDAASPASLIDLLGDPGSGGGCPEAIAAALRQCAPLADADVLFRAGGTATPASATVQPLTGVSERLSGAALVLLYPTKRWSDVARSHRRNEERLGLALSAARLGSWEYDIRTRGLVTSAQCKANHGFRADEDMQLEHIVEAIYPEHRSTFIRAIDTAIESGGSFEVEVPHRWPDGTDHWLQVAGRVVDPTCMVGVSRDISARHWAEQALRQSEQQYRALVDAASEGIWRLDRDGRITFANQRMGDLLGVAVAEMLGRHKSDFVSGTDAADVSGFPDCGGEGAAPERADVRFRRSDGTEVWTLMSARPLHGENGGVAGAVALFTDITDRRRAEQAVRESDRRKDEFLAVLGHELRAPLAPILTAVKLLQAKGPDEPGLNRLRDTILRQTMQLSTLVDDLLDVARISVGKLQLDRAVVDLCGVVAQAIETSTALMERHGHRLAVRVPGDPVLVDGDASRLVQVVSNLLNNAAKYTPDGGTVEVGLACDAGAAVVVVRDDGVGIPAGMLDSIFDRFVQLGGSVEPAEGGLGVGLSVVRAIVERHGGRVEARSAGPGQGSEFAVRLPLAETSNARPPGLQR